LDEVIRILLQKLKTSKYFKELIFNTLICRWPIYYFWHRRQLAKGSLFII
jgi:hypothetical protein